MSKQISASELSLLMLDHLGEGNQYREDFVSAIARFETEMTDAAEALASHLGVEVSSPAGEEGDMGFLVGFASDCPSEEAIDAFEDYDASGNLDD